MPPPLHAFNRFFWEYLFFLAFPGVSYYNIFMQNIHNHHKKEGKSI